MEQKKLTKADLRKVFLRSLTIMCSWNYERQMHMGFMCGMSPVLDKLYADDEERKKDAHRRLWKSRMPILKKVISRQNPFL